MRRVLRHRQRVHRHERAFSRDQVIDVDPVICLAGAVARLESIAGPGDGKTDVAVRQRIDIFRGVEFLDVAPHAADKWRDGCRLSSWSLGLSFM